MKIWSPAFKADNIIPQKYSSAGSDINPPITLEGIPQEARSLVLVIEDPDPPTGSWVHWIVYDIPVRSSIEENSVPGKEGLNDFHKTRYGGPWPPDRKHRYRFVVFALDTILNIPPGTDKKDVVFAMNGHVIDVAECYATFDGVHI
jgi:Raf kinase inhibitor-like YbhB/YbcL family protein